MTVLKTVKRLIAGREFIMIESLIILLISRAASLTMPVATKYFLDGTVSQGPARPLAISGVLLVAAICLKALCALALNAMGQSNALRIVGSVRIAAYSRLLRAPLAVHHRNSIGDLISRLMSDASNIPSLCGTSMLTFCGDVITSFLALVLMFTFNIKLSVMFLFVEIVFLILYFSFFRPAPQAFQRGNALLGKAAAYLQSTLNGICEIKINNFESLASSHFTGIANDLVDYQITLRRRIARSLAAGALFQDITSVIVLFYGIRLVLAHQMTPGTWLSFLFLTSLAGAAAYHLPDYLSEVENASAGAQRIFSIIDTPPENAIHVSADGEEFVSGSLTCAGLSFSYPSGKLALRNISFSAAPGTITAVVGHSGAGKSTLFALLAKLYAPDAGDIRLGNLDVVNADLAKYRNMLAFVQQDSFMFEMSILENVRLGCPTASEEEVQRVCRIARVNDFLNDRPDGLNTILGDGLSLSGGQKQRIAIARALLRRPSLLLLDEPTSQLDPMTESEIVRNLQQVTANQVTLIATHRLSTIRAASRIVVLHEGELIEQGSHPELLSLRGHYHNLFSSALVGHA